MPTVDKKKIKKVYSINFGCRLNQYESISIETSLQKSEWEVSENINDADYIIINTCTVTNRADIKNRQAIRKAKRENPNAKIIVTGCYATTDSKKLQSMEEVSQIVGNNQKSFIPSILNNKNISNFSDSISEQSIFEYQSPSIIKNARSYLKIQDGCDKKCSYCKIPVARGKGISRNYQAIESEVKSLLETGYQEIILTGVNIGHYKNNNGANFNDLLRNLNNVPGNFYYRISSLEPDHLNEDLINIINNGKFARFLHLPIQSGSDKVLKLMKRPYTVTFLKKSISMLKSKAPLVHIGTDVIVGFPGETEEDFQETIKMVEYAEYANIHIFPFSRRSGTSIDDQLNDPLTSIKPVNGSIIRERITRLMEVKNKLYKKYIQNSAGITYKAIIESVDFKIATIVTENFIKLSLPVQKNFKKGMMINVQYDETLNCSFIDHRD